jgi:hypothetical protein
MRATVLGWVLPLVVLTSVAHAETSTVPTSPRAALDQGARLRATGDVKGAIQALKAGKSAFPDHEQIRQALALAYLQDGNEFWALKVLREYEDEHPPACDTRAFQAWIHIQQANFDLADEILDTPGCDTPDYVAARTALLRAHMASQHGDTKAAGKHVEQARQAGRYYEEDKALLDAMTARFDPGRMPVTSWRADLAVGWTSNGLAGSPVDPADVGTDTQSPLVQLDARMRVVIPASRTLRPVLEAQVRTLDLMATTVGALSYRQPSFRPGVLIGDSTPRLLLTYGFDAVQIAGGDRYEQGPLWYSEGHRFDYEIEVNDYLFAFGGAGHREYREAGRTRFEGEHGLAVGLPISDEVRVMGGGSARWYRAANQAYDAQGATVLGQVQVRLPAGLEGRVNASVSYDRYPRSRGYFPGSQGDARADLQTRLKPGLWSPSWSGFRVGLDYEVSHRDSTAINYEYNDHRVLLHGVWVMDGDRFGVDLVSTDGREPLPHGVSASGQLAGDEMRIRDLMQQDEAVKRGSSCLN